MIGPCDIASVTDPHVPEHSYSQEKDRHLGQVIGCREYRELDPAQDRQGDDRRDPDTPHDDDHLHRVVVCHSGGAGLAGRPPLPECQTVKSPAAAAISVRVLANCSASRAMINPSDASRVAMLRVSKVRSWRVDEFENYLIFYTFDGDRLDILRVKHGAMKFPRALR